MRSIRLAAEHWAESGGKSTDPDDVWQNDVEGVTTVTSPTLDLTGIDSPQVGDEAIVVGTSDAIKKFAQANPQ